MKNPQKIDREREILDYFLSGATPEQVHALAGKMRLNSKQKHAFLSIYAPTQKVDFAAKEAGTVRRNFNRWRKDVPKMSLAELKRLVLTVLCVARKSS